MRSSIGFGRLLMSDKGLEQKSGLVGVSEPCLPLARTLKSNGFAWPSFRALFAAPSRSRSPLLARFGGIWYTTSHLDRWDGRAVRSRTANPLTAVQLRFPPPFEKPLMPRVFCFARNRWCAQAAFGNLWYNILP